tara:strand:- start:776 stop:1405 length:630 start_codon:yes stop_codon:yes gene_type:complete
MTDDTNIHNGMMTKVWGPPGWFFLHCVTFGFPVSPEQFDRDKGLEQGTTANAYYKFFMNVGDILPCRYCRESYKEFLKDENVGPPNVTNRETLVKWFWQMHNRVNAKLGDTYENASLENIKERYERYRARCDKNKLAQGCSVPLSGKKMCSKVDVAYCESVQKYEIEGFTQSGEHGEFKTCRKKELFIMLVGFIILRILFGILSELVCF